MPWGQLIDAYLCGQSSGYKRPTAKKTQALRFKVIDNCLMLKQLGIVCKSLAKKEERLLLTR